jgi:signal transduction histidine kinase
MSQLNLLVIDDEMGIRKGIVRILRNYSVDYPYLNEEFVFNVSEAETAEQGLEMMRQSKPDIVLLDNKLPGMSGIELLELIKQENIDVYVMMITSFASLDLAVRATKNGAYNFIPKPFTPDELKIAINDLSKHLFLKRVTKQMQDTHKEANNQFLSILSHELKSPLNAVDGYLKLMSDQQLGSDLEDYKEMIERSMVRINGMRNLIGDLLDLTRLGSGEKVRHLKNINLKQVAEHSMETLQPMANENGIRLVISSELQSDIQADEDEIEIIFNNLISNAIKYNKPNGLVKVLLSQTQSDYIIRVKDTGIGMAESDIEKLFHEFTRIKNQQTQHISGSGLGLSILKKMVEKYHGEIKINSQLDEGSEFTVSIPFSAQ